MHTSNNRVRKVAKDIVMAFAHHIKDRVQSEDDDYIALGVDNEFDTYEALFRSVAGKVLGVQSGIVRIFPNNVVVETLDLIDAVVENKGHRPLIQNSMLAECVFDVCLYILKKVKEDEFEDELVELN